MKGSETISNKEFAKKLIDQIPESKIPYVISYLQGVAVPEETPNIDTLEAIQEVDKMIASGTSEHFTGSTTDFFASFV